MYRMGKGVQLMVFQRRMVFVCQRHWPEPCNQKLCPVYCGTGGPYPVIIIRKFLGFYQTLTPAAGTAVHIRVQNRSPVQYFRHCLAEHSHLMRGVGAPVFHTLPDDLPAGVCRPVGTIFLVAGITGSRCKSVDYSKRQCPSALPVVGGSDLCNAARAGSAARRSGKSVIPRKR